jgi:hypothetical protein
MIYTTLNLWGLSGFAFAGALLLWCRLGNKAREVYQLSNLLRRFIRNDSIREKIEPVLFVLLGTVLSIGIIQPSTPAQAFAAGVGWTSLASKY